MDYRELCLLWAARESGLLEAVTFHAGTPEGVAEEAGVTERAARITLEAMAERGYLKELDSGYETTNKALGFVSKTDVRSIGRIPHQLDCLDRWFDLPETMETGDLPDNSKKDDDRTANFVGAMDAVDEAAVRASVTEAVHRNPAAERVLDAGGGPGRFAKEFVRRGFDVTLFDQSEVIDIDRRFLEHEPIELVEGDVTEELPGGFDIVFCSRLAHGLGPEENQQLLANAADALVPGGAVVLTDKVRGHADDAALFGAHMLAQTEHGDTYTEAQFADWFDAAGFEAFEIRDVPGTQLQALTGIAPRD